MILENKLHREFCDNPKDEQGYLGVHYMSHIHPTDLPNFHSIELCLGNPGRRQSCTGRVTSSDGFVETPWVRLNLRDKEKGLQLSVTGHAGN